MKHFPLAASDILNRASKLTFTFVLEIPERKIKGQSNKEEFLDVKSCANFTGLSRQKLYSLVSQKQIPFLRDGYRIFFLKHHINQWLLKMEVSGLKHKKVAEKAGKNS